MDSLEELPLLSISPTQLDPFGGTQSRDRAKARGRSTKGRGAQAWSRAAPTDRAREVGPNEFSLALPRAVGVVEYLAQGCPRRHRNRENCLTTPVHARTCHQDGAQVNMHEPLKHVISKALNGIAVKHDVESGERLSRGKMT